MLFKNLFFACLLAGKALASPFSITIEIDENNLDLPPVRPTEHAYETITKLLDTQFAYIQVLDANITTLKERGSDGWKDVVSNLKKNAKGLNYAAKSIPNVDLGEGDCVQIEFPFERTVTAMYEFCHALKTNKDIIAALDEKDQIFGLVQNDRNAWNQMYNALQKHLYKCTDEEKKNGCEGATFFNYIENGFAKKFLETQRLFAKKSDLQTQWEI